MTESKNLDKYTVKFDLFEKFNEIQNLSEGFELLEISLRQGQIMFMFKPDLISISSFEKILDMVLLKEGDPLKIIDKDDALKKFSSVGFIEDNPILVINTTELHEDYGFTDLFKTLIDTIIYAANNICKCPALEIIFSSQYIKCFLDKPGITVSDVQKYEEMFELKGTLELFGQRPYLLLINDNFEE